MKITISPRDNPSSACFDPTFDRICYTDLYENAHTFTTIGVLQIMAESRVARARAAEKLLRSKFEREKAEEWIKQSANARVEVENAIYDAYTAGVSVIQIARDYGTTNRGTIYEILKNHKTYTDLIEEVTPDPLTITSLENGNVRISVHNYADWTQTAPEPYSGSIDLNLTTQVPVVGSASTEGGPLHRELASAPLTSPLWTYILEHTQEED